MTSYADEHPNSGSGSPILKLEPCVRSIHELFSDFCQLHGVSDLQRLELVIFALVESEASPRELKATYAEFWRRLGMDLSDQASTKLRVVGLNESDKEQAPKPTDESLNS